VEQLAKLKEWDTVFPAVAEVEKEASNAHKYAEELWEQLDHLGYVTLKKTLLPNNNNSFIFPCFFPIFSKSS
jgi:hypothetical protein